MERITQLETILLKGFPTNPYIPTPFNQRIFHSHSKPCNRSVQLKRANCYVKRLKRNLFRLEVLLPSHHPSWTQLVQIALSGSFSIQSKGHKFLSKLKDMKTLSKGLKRNSSLNRTFTFQSHCMMPQFFPQKKRREKIPGIRPRRTILPRKGVF